MAMEPTTASSSATTDHDPEEEIDHHLAEEALTNKALLQMIFKYHHEVRLRLVVVRTDRDTDGSTQTADLDNHIALKLYPWNMAKPTVSYRDRSRPSTAWRPGRAADHTTGGPQPPPRQHSDTTQYVGLHTGHKSTTSATLSK